jgi:hypothetical protein
MTIPPPVPSLPLLLVVFVLGLLAGAWLVGVWLAYQQGRSVDARARRWR